MIRARLDEIRVAFMLLTRLPMGQVARTVPMGATAWAWPLVGLVSGGISAAALALPGPDLAMAVLAVAAGLLVTGAMHEDGLADVADGFGGGRTTARKLEIMRDSRLGTYGAAALVLALLLRVALLAEVGAWDVVAAAVASRALLPALQMGMPQAREAGLGARAAQGASVTGVLIAAAMGVAALCLSPLALLALVAVQAGVAWLARRQIGGVTGDVLGAAQVGGELAVLLALT